MLDLNPPDHTRLRSLVHKAFTPSLVEQIRSRTGASFIHLRNQTTFLEVGKNVPRPIQVSVCFVVAVNPAIQHSKIVKSSSVTPASLV